MNIFWVIAGESVPGKLTDASVLSPPAPDTPSREFGVFLVGVDPTLRQLHVCDALRRDHSNRRVTDQFENRHGQSEFRVKQHLYFGCH